MGKGWKEVDTFEDLEDIDEYESDDEVSALPTLPSGSRLRLLMLMK